MAKKSLADFKQMKASGQKFATITAYDTPTARVVEKAKLDLILVGDSLANVALGYADTVPVSLDEMIHHAKAVRRGAPNTFVVGDLPFLSYQISVEKAVESAGRFLKEAHVDAVKLEGGKPMLPTIKRLTEVGIPVMGHLGLTPQSATQLGGYRVQGAKSSTAHQILEDAKAIEEAGAFSLVLECVPQELAMRISKELSIPTVGIGAGKACDAQILVLSDLLGYDSGFKPRFVRRYLNIEELMVQAVSEYKSDVEQQSFPSSKESFAMPEGERQKFES